MATIELTQGKVAIVDEADYPRLSREKWHAVEVAPGYWYARNGRREYMHRVLMNPAPGMVPDHINGDGLDNRRINLRVVTHRQNVLRAQQRPGESGYLGVSRTPNGRWRAHIKVRGRKVHLGTFTTAEEAAQARDLAAREHHGDFAVLNFT